MPTFDPKSLSGLLALQRGEKKPETTQEPAKQPKTHSFKGLADMIARQTNAKVSEGDKEKAAQAKATDVAKIAKDIMNTAPEKIIKAAENATEFHRVNAPVISLKLLLDQAKKKSEQTPPALQPGAPNINTDTAIATVQKPTQEAVIYEFDPDQDRAIKGMVANQFACVIGKAGTGKTKSQNDFVKVIETQIATLEYQVKDADGNYVTKFKPSIVFCSFTGRAVEMMKRKLDPKWHSVCGTIHGEHVLAYVPEFYEEIDEKTGDWRNKVKFVPSYNETRKLPYTIYVIDETGMLSVDLWNTLRKAMRPDARVYFFGDINQLPPVYGRSILGYAMSKWPTFELNTIHRQARDNPIIANAHRILEGNIPVEVKGRFDLVNLGDKGSLNTQTFILNVIKKMHSGGKFDEMKDGFIVPQNVGPLGQLTLNELLVPYFNPEKSAANKRHLIRTGISMVHYARGDKIMLLANDKQNNLTNGQMGLITNVAFNGAYSDTKGGVTHADLQKLHSTEVDEENFTLEIESSEETKEPEKEKEVNQRQASHIVTARFGEFRQSDLAEYEAKKAVIDNIIAQRGASYYSDEFVKLEEELKDALARLNQTSREVSFSTAGEFRIISHAYAFTCHKSQGGEYPTVIILVHSANAVLLSREWLYTAVTRAQIRVVLVFNQRGLMLALKNQKIKGNNLQQKIKSFIEASEKDVAKKGDDAIIPDLPHPMRILPEAVVNQYQQRNEHRE